MSAYVYRAYGVAQIWDEILQAMRPIDRSNPDELALTQRYNEHLKQSLQETQDE